MCTRLVARKQLGTVTYLGLDLTQGRVSLAGPAGDGFWPMKFVRVGVLALASAVSLGILFLRIHPLVPAAQQ